MDCRVLRAEGRSAWRCLELPLVPGRRRWPVTAPGSACAPQQVVSAGGGRPPVRATVEGALTNPAPKDPRTLSRLKAYLEVDLAVDRLETSRTAVQDGRCGPEQERGAIPVFVRVRAREAICGPTSDHHPRCQTRPLMIWGSAAGERPSGLGVNFTAGAAAGDGELYAALMLCLRVG